MARILILGGNGFIGLNLSASLIENGHEIVCADRAMPPKKGKSIPLNQLEYKIGDLADLSFLHSLFYSEPYDWVIHLACSLIPSSNYSDFIRERELNITGGFELIQSMRNSGSKKLLFFSTGGAIYGNNGQDLNDEDSALIPLNYYAYSKLLMEEYIQLEARLSGLEYMIVRPSNPYGAGQNLFGRQGLIAVTLGKLISQENPQVWGDGSVIRDYLHISDLCNSIDKLISKGKLNEIYNIGSGIGYSVNEVMKVIQTATGNEFKIDYSDGRTVDVPVNILNINKLKAHTGFSPKIDLEVGISTLWNEMLLTSSR
ncbi:MAG: NAD-dependent epimerase/dehydratase family protein [Bacteroidia bacterium]